MKILQLSVFFSFIYFATSAQFDEANWVLGGSGNIHVSANATNNIGTIAFSNSSYFVHPSFARVLKGRTLIGLVAGVSGNQFKASDSSESEINFSKDFGLFYQRYYSLTKNLFLNWKAAAGVGFNKNTYEFSLSKTTTNYATYRMEVAPGISWKVMDRLLLNGSIGAASFDYTEKNRLGNSSNSFAIRLNRPQFGPVEG